MGSVVALLAFVTVLVAIHRCSKGSLAPRPARALMAGATVVGVMGALTAIPAPTTTTAAPEPRVLTTIAPRAQPSSSPDPVSSLAPTPSLVTLSAEPVATPAATQPVTLTSTRPTTAPPPTTAPRPTTTAPRPTTTAPRPTTSAPKPEGGVQSYPNCAALNRDYPHGVGRSGAVDLTNGVPKAVQPRFYVSDAMYAANTGRDRDQDGVACER